MTPDPPPGDDWVAAVVVPIFGVRDHLAECLESIAGQTWAERVQVVLVDDGSTDGSGELAAEHVRRHPAWRLIRQANAGPGAGAARNRGLELVEAPFVLFCDGDDVLERDAVERLVTAATSTGADLVVGAARQFPEERRWRWSEYFEPSDGEVVPARVEEVPELVHHPAPGDKLFRVSALRDHGLAFAEGVHHQDTVVTIPLMLLTPTVAIVRSVVQGYRRVPGGGSVMDGQFVREQNTWDHLSVLETLVRWRPGLTPARRVLLDGFLVRSFQGYLARAARLDEPAAREVFRRARSLYADVDPDLVLRMTSGAVHALAYRAVVEDDLAAFLDPGRRVLGFDLGGEGARLSVPGIEPSWDGALAVGRTRAHVSGMVRAGDRLVVRGTARVQGSPALADLPPCLSVRLRGASITAPATVERITGPDALTVSAFTVELPVDGLPDGRFDLRMVLSAVAGQGQRSARSEPPEGPVVCRLPGRRRAVLTGSDTGAVLEIGPHPPGVVRRALRAVRSG